MTQLWAQRSHGFLISTYCIFFGWCEWCSQKALSSHGATYVVRKKSKLFIFGRKKLIETFKFSFLIVYKNLTGLRKFWHRMQNLYFLLTFQNYLTKKYFYYILILRVTSMGHLAVGILRWVFKLNYFEGCLWADHTFNIMSIYGYGIVHFVENLDFHRSGT